MTASEHAPYVVPMADAVDRWVLCCGCPCGLFVEYATRSDAEDARDEAEVKP